MFKKIIFTVSFILISFYGTAQKDINNYKYIIVPKAFNFTTGEDQHQLSSITKFLFNKYGYQAFFTDDDFPVDLQNERCLGLISKVTKVQGGMFKTKLEIVLEDCFGTVVMKSQIGESRLKKYDRAYNEALRNAFKTFQNLEYQYVHINAQIEVKESIIAKPKEKPKVESKKTQEEVADKVTSSKDKKQKPQKNIQMQSSVKKNRDNLYYAQAIKNGYQLVNSEPKIVMILLATAAKNVFIVKDKSAIVFKEDGFWYYSENDGILGEKTSLNIKF